MRLKTVLLVFFFLTVRTTVYAQHDTIAINETNALAWKLRFSNIDTSILLTKKALAALGQIGDSQGLSKNWKEKSIARSNYYLGIFYNDRGDNKLCYDYLNLALKLSTEIGDFYGMAQAFGGLGNAYMHEGNFAKASENYFKALESQEKRGYKAGMAVQYSNLGNIFASQGQTKKALDYYSKSLALARELHDSIRIGIQLGNIGIIYYEQKNLEKALDYYFQALKITEQINNKTGIATNLNNIASIYQDKKDYAKSLEYYSRALRLAEEYGNKDHIASFIGNIGILHMHLNNFPKAEANLLNALKISEEIKSTEAVKEFEGALSELYTKWGKHALALEHFKKHISARDTIFNIASAEKNVRLEMNYEFEKEKAINDAIHQKQVLLLEAENKVQKQLRLFLFIILGLALLLLFVLRRAYENKKKIATFLTEESQRKETLLQEVHHRINNNLQIISSLLTLQASSVGDERLNEYLSQSQSRIQSLSVLHELLYQKDSTLDINMKEYLNEVLNFHRDVLSGKSLNVTMKVEVSSVHFPTRIAVPIALIINELVTNSIKYAFTGITAGQIDIVLAASQAQGSDWILKVSDNGKGMLPGETAKKESLGLRLVNLMAKQIKAEVSRNYEKGTSFTVSFTSHG